MKKILIMLLLPDRGVGANTFALPNVEKIMRDPKWIGVAPSNIFGPKMANNFTLFGIQTKRWRFFVFISRLTNQTPQKVSPAHAGHCRAMAITINCERKIWTGWRFVSARHRYMEKFRPLRKRWSANRFNAVLERWKILFNMGMNLFSWEIGIGTFCPTNRF